MDSSSFYTPSYECSYALIIGINDYANASPLGYAVNDAQAVAEILEKNFDFKNENIKLLVNEYATHDRIMSAFLTYANKKISPNDRIFIFFAGHGSTHEGKRGEVGFLVPYDGDLSNIATLIRWDELTRNSELIRAKHILFVMDACYGGLAITRALPAGSTRFLKDMLQRYCRQVLTAGKANEVVADAGGPIPNHSVFTGHFLQALNGNAATGDGIITANGVMAYVYDRVAKDRYSKQTPHYGFLDGDGDFIFKAPALKGIIDKEELDQDVLISLPTPTIVSTSLPLDDLISKTKECLSDDRYKIKLHDMFNQKTREVIALLGSEQFKARGGIFSDEELSRRIKAYTDIVKESQAMAVCVAYWGNKSHNQLLCKPIVRICENFGPADGLTVWLNLRWYPIFLLMYSSGIAAVSANNYDALATILTTKVQSPHNSSRTIDLALSAGYIAAELHDVFKRLPGHDRHHVPRSEYLFKILQPDLDDLLYLGRGYEQMFDRFEVMLALTHADLRYQKEQDTWGPVGRFGWKYSSNGESDNPLSILIAEAKAMASEWPPLKAGFFGGDLQRFSNVVNGYEAQIKKLNWW